MIDEVLFLRHGRTAYNLARRLQGQIDIPLDIVGRCRRTKARTNSPKPTIGRKSRISPNITTSSRNPHTATPSGRRRRNQQRARRGPPHARRLIGSVPRAADRARLRRPHGGWTWNLDPRLRERQLRRMGGHDPRGDLRALRRRLPFLASHTGGETKHGVESRIHTGRRGAEAVRDIVAKHHDETMLPHCFSSATLMDRATVAVLLDMDPDDLNNVARCATLLDAHDPAHRPQERGPSHLEA